jgi:hypothetical protein
MGTELRNAVVLRAMHLSQDGDMGHPILLSHWNRV